MRFGFLRAYGISLDKVSALTHGIEPLANSLSLPGFDVGAYEFAPYLKEQQARFVDTIKRGNIKVE